MILKNFIVFEGIDGAGTSTQIKRIVESNPQKYIATAEPTKGETGKFLRRMLAGEFHVDEKTNAYLFAADRCEHLYGKDGVIQMLNEGKTVISDRYSFSSIAYQSVGCGTELPEHLNKPFPLPEYLFFFEINPEISLGRVNSRNEKKEIYEKIEWQNKTAALYEAVVSKYEKECKNKKSEAYGMKIIRVDATKSIEEITDFISSILNK